MNDSEREYVIRVEKPWKLWILPGLAIAYFVVLLALVILRVAFVINGQQYLVQDIPGLIWLGAAFFVLVLLIELPFFLRRRPPAPEPPPEERETDLSSGMMASGVMGVDDERMVTAEQQQGLRVLEYSSPAKSRNRGAVYAKTYVPVTKGDVLRIETLAAEPTDL
jgi:hypothetical protein